MKKEVVKYLVVSLLCAFSLTSCGALFQGTTQTVFVTSSPQESAVEVDNTKHVTPAQIELARNKSYTVTISKQGYETRQIKILKKVSRGTIILDALGGVVPLVMGTSKLSIAFMGPLGIAPLVIDAVMGTWYNLAPDQINVTLTTKQSGMMDIPVKMRIADDTSLKVTAPERVHIKIEQTE